jgi:hypothetical protein
MQCMCGNAPKDGGFKKPAGCKTPCDGCAHFSLTFSSLSARPLQTGPFFPTLLLAVCSRCAQVLLTFCSRFGRSNTTQMCGGQFEIGIYSFKCEGTPVPLPPVPAPPPPPHLNKPCATFNEYGCAEIYNPCINITSPQVLPFPLIALSYFSHFSLICLIFRILISFLSFYRSPKCPSATTSCRLMSG